MEDFEQSYEKPKVGEMLQEPKSYSSDCMELIYY